MALFDYMLENIITEAFSPSEKAHQLGLTHAGWGYWKDNEGDIVARTVGDQLIKLTGVDPDEWEKGHETELDDPEYSEIAQAGGVALESLAQQLVDHCGLNVEKVSEFIPLIKMTIQDGKLPDLSMLNGHFDKDEIEQIATFLSFLAKGKTKLVMAVAMSVRQSILDDQQQQAKAKKALANIIIPEEPAQSNSDEIIQKANHGQVDIDYAGQLMGLPIAVTYNPKFMELMGELDGADNGPAVNYIAMKLKKSGFIDKVQWKKLHKYLKSIKDIKQGPKVPGKIKNKTLEALTNKAEEAMESGDPEWDEYVNGQEDEPEVVQHPDTVVNYDDNGKPVPDEPEQSDELDKPYNPIEHSTYENAEVILSQIQSDYWEANGTDLDISDVDKNLVMNYVQDALQANTNSNAYKDMGDLAEESDLYPEELTKIWALVQKFRGETPAENQPENVGEIELQQIANILDKTNTGMFANKEWLNSDNFSTPEEKKTWINAAIKYAKSPTELNKLALKDSAKPIKITNITKTIINYYKDKASSTQHQIEPHVAKVVDSVLDSIGLSPLAYIGTVSDAGKPYFAQAIYNFVKDPTSENAKILTSKVGEWTANAIIKKHDEKELAAYNKSPYAIDPEQLKKVDDVLNSVGIDFLYDMTNATPEGKKKFADTLYAYVNDSTEANEKALAAYDGYIGKEGDIQKIIYQYKTPTNSNDTFIPQDTYNEVNKVMQDLGLGSFQNMLPTDKIGKKKFADAVYDFVTIGDEASTDKLYNVADEIGVSKTAKYIINDYNSKNRIKTLTPLIPSNLTYEDTDGMNDILAGHGTGANEKEWDDIVNALSKSISDDNTTPLIKTLEKIGFGDGVIGDMCDLAIKSMQKKQTEIKPALEKIFKDNEIPVPVQPDEWDEILSAVEYAIQNDNNNSLIAKINGLGFDYNVASEIAQFATDMSNKTWASKKAAASSSETPLTQPVISQSTPTTVSALEDYPVPEGAQSAVDKSMQGWAKGNAETVLNWVIKNFEGKGKLKNPKPWHKKHAQNMAMSLVLNYGLPLENVPDFMIPDEAKEMANAAMQTYEPEQMPEIPLPTSPETPELDNSEDTTEADAAGLVSVAMSNTGAKLTPEQQTKLIAAVEQASNEQTEFGVYHAFLKLQKEGVPSEVIESLKYNIIEKLTLDGALDSTPGAFKKYFDYDDMLDRMQKGEFSEKGGMQSTSVAEKAKFQQWLTTLSPEDRAKLADAMKVGLSFDTQPEAMEYYKKALATSIPGWDDEIATVWRRALRGYHDDFKEAEKFEQQKKAEKLKKIQQEVEAKKAAVELQKAMDSITSGDMGDTIKAIVKAADLKNLTATSVKDLMLAISKALNSSNSTEMMDHLHKLAGYNSYNGGLSGDSSMFPQPYYSDNADFEKLAKLVAATYFEKNHPYNPKNEPTTTEPINLRADRVVGKWTKENKQGLRVVPSENSERNYLEKAINVGVSEPNPKQAMSQFHSIVATHTSLTDDQTAQLRNLIQQERQHPGSLNGEPLPTWDWSAHTADGQGKVYDPTAIAPKVAPNVKLPTKSIASDPEWKAKSAYYKLPTANKEQIHDAVLDALASGFGLTKFQKSSFVNSLEQKLLNYGVNPTTSHLVALWTSRQAELQTPLATKAKTQTDKYYAAIGQIAPTSNKVPVPNIQEEKIARQHIAALPNVPSTYIAKTEFVKGEFVKYSPTGINLNEKPLEYQHTADEDAKNQDQWRKGNLSTEEYDQFDDGADSWQGGGQWAKKAKQRKATNHIYTKSIEGPPPQYAHVEHFIERGISLTPDNFKEFIKGFVIGEKVYLGPSGFSANSSTAKNFGGIKSGNSNEVNVLLRVRPPLNKKIKAARLNWRNGHSQYSNEQEIVYGTGKHSRVIAVTKHVAGQSKVVYEIEMEYDESSLNEGIERISNDYGFRPELWKGLSPETIKMFIKYLNTSVGQAQNIR